MVLVSVSEVLEESDLMQVLDDDEVKDYQNAAVERLIEYYSEVYCGLIQAESVETEKEKMSEAVIGYRDPRRLIRQVEKYHKLNIALAKGKLKEAVAFFKKHNITLEFVLNPDNFNTITSEDYIDGHWKVADCFTILSGREHDDLSFYDLTDSSGRISSHQMQSVKENSEDYALIPITYKN